MKIEIKEVMNGYVVTIQKGEAEKPKPYVYSANDPLRMLEFIGKELLNPKRVKVEER